MSIAFAALSATPMYVPLVSSGRMASLKARIGAVLSPEELLRRCQAGDRDAFAELFRRHRADVARIVHRMADRGADIDDLVQEVFVQVHKSLATFRAESRFSTWLYRVAVNVVLMHRRAKRSRPVTLLIPREATLLDDASPPDEQVARRRRIEALYRLLDRLSEKKRAVYVLHEIEGLPPNEIAKILGAPVLTVRTRLFYARRELAALLHEEPALRSLATAFDPATEPDEDSSTHHPHKEPA
jgi:RNA polymerase sigma-70 factor (ECF subfamily)